MGKVTPISLQQNSAQRKINEIQSFLKTHLRGKDQIIEFSLATFFAQGHLLLEGPPGTGKTSLAKAMAVAFEGSFRRIQMTSDLLPSDIVGILRLKPGTTDFEFRKGPLFTNFLLADELNRTSPKTQSALLEAMAEGTATVDGQTHILPKPFFVVATQNPLEFQGVYPLAESQLDRFMLQLSISSPDKSYELEIYHSYQTIEASSLKGTQHSLNLQETQTLYQEVAKIYIEASVIEYIADLIRATRALPHLAFGVSVRGGIQLLAASRALAFIRGRNFVIPKDVMDLAIPALAHRLCFTQGEPDTQQRHTLIQEILDRIRPPK